MSHTDNVVHGGIRAALHDKQWCRNVRERHVGKPALVWVTLCIHLRPAALRVERCGAVACKWLGLGLKLGLALSPLGLLGLDDSMGEWNAWDDPKNVRLGGISCQANTTQVQNMIVFRVKVRVEPTKVRVRV